MLQGLRDLLNEGFFCLLTSALSVLYGLKINFPLICVWRLVSETLVAMQGIVTVRQGVALNAQF